MRDRRRHLRSYPIAAEVLENRLVMSANIAPTFDLLDTTIQPVLPATNPQTVPNFAQNISPGGPIGWKSYSIPVGKNYTGVMPYLAFVNDHDAPVPSANSQFRNIVIRETNTGLTRTINLEDTPPTPYAGNQDSGIGDVDILDEGVGIRLTGNRWQKIQVDYTVTKYTVLEFEFRSDAKGEVHGIGFSRTNDPDSRRVYKLYGSEDWGQRQFDNLYALPPEEANQQVAFELIVDRPELFTVAPAISPTGTLTYTPAAGNTGLANVSVTLRDNGGTVDGGDDTSDPQVFQIMFTISGENRLPTLGHEELPDFAAYPTNVTVTSGDWSDPATWTDGVPEDGDIVLIQAEHTVEILGTTARLKAIGVAGVLVNSGELRVKDAIVYAEGEFNGTPGSVVTFLDQPINIEEDPDQFGTGLLVMGTIVTTGQVKSSMLDLDSEAFAGQNQLLLDENAVDAGWKVGDRLIIPETRQPHGKDGIVGNQWEARTITAIDGDLVTLDSPLLYDHKGARNADGELQMVPTIQNLTRDVVFRSENPQGTRGHVLVTEQAIVALRGAAFQDLGRTTTNARDQTLFDENGNVTHIGLNQNGRYPLHVHHLSGPPAGYDTPAWLNLGEYQYVLEGLAIDGGDLPHKFRWGITLHASHHGLIKNNAVYNAAGSGIVTEDGSEYRNVIEDNVVYRVIGTGKPYEHSSKDAGDGGYGFWFRGPHNTVRNNVSAGSFRTAFYQLSRTRGNTTPASRMIPPHPGAHPDEYILGPPLTTTPFYQFAGNEAYSSYEAVELYRGNGEDPMAEPSVISYTTAWHTVWGIRPQYDMNLVINGWQQYGDPAMLGATQYPAIGINGTMSYTHSLIVRNAYIENMDVGILHDGLKFGAYMLIENPILRNIVNIRVAPGGNQSLIPGLTKLTVIQSPTFGGIGEDAPLFDLQLVAGPLGADDKLLETSKVRLLDYEGQDWDVYWDAQRPDALLPVHSSIPLNLQGQTNQFAWDSFGKAFAGELVPVGAVVLDRIGGWAKAV